ncbi:hypothetical protein FJZ53_07135 [Candidatus Woesearchaeota archaeon]|nr:hypothetical protein [Candidatus Woesearchaeota archaeon]
MNKKVLTSIIMILVVLIFAFSIEAEIFSTIATQGLSFASPQAASAVQTVLKAYQVTTDPSGFLTGQVTGQITSQMMGEIAESSPEAAKAIQQYNQVDGWVKQGAKINEDLKMDSKGGLAGGKLELNEKEQELGQMINPDKKDLSVKATNVEVSTQGEGKDITLTSKKDGYVEINGKRYMLKENSKIVMDREGNVKETDATFSQATSIELGGTKYDVPKNGKIVYKDGVATITAGPEDTVKINSQNIKIGEGSITHDSGKLTGKDFTVDNTRFTPTENGLAEVTLDKRGYILGENTIAQNNDMKITSEEGNVLLSKACGSVSGFDNYVNPCKNALVMNGEGFSVQMKEGKHFGLNIEKGDYLEYTMDGGKVVINNGKQGILLDQGESVTMLNGDRYERYAMINGEKMILADKDFLTGDYDVPMSTELAAGPGENDYIMAVQNEQKNLQVENPDENVYVCEASGSSNSFGILPEVEAQSCKLGATQAPNPKVKFGYASAKAGQGWYDEKITGIYDKTGASVEVHTETKSGDIKIYRLNSDGTLERKQLGDWVVDKSYTLNADDIAYFGLKPGAAQTAKPTVSKEVQAVDSVYLKGVKRKVNWMEVD